MKSYLRDVLLALIAVSPVVLMQANAKPERPSAFKKTEKHQYPDLNYKSNWGHMKIDRDTGEMIFFGHPQWDGEAQFVTAKKVYVMWYELPSRRPAPGVYEIRDDNTLVGHWGYDTDVLVDQEEWTIAGKIMADTVHPVK